MFVLHVRRAWILTLQCMGYIKKAKGINTTDWGWDNQG